MKLKTIVQLALLALLIALIGCGGGHVAGNPGAPLPGTSGSTSGSTAGSTSGSTSGTTA